MSEGGGFMKISNGYMLGFGMMAVAFTFTQAYQSTGNQNLLSPELTDRAPAQVEYVNNGTGNTLTYNGQPVAPTNTGVTAAPTTATPVSSTFIGPMAPIIPQTATYGMIERSYTSALYNETQLKLQQDAVAAQLTQAQDARAQIAQQRPTAVMYPNNTYDSTIKKLQQQITQYKNARSNNLTMALMNMDFTYASVKYSLNRDQMVQATLERNHLIKLNQDIYADINLPADTSGLNAQNQALLELIQKYQQTQAPQQVPAATQAVVTDPRTYTMPAEPNMEAPATATPVTAPTNNAESPNQVIIPTEEAYTSDNYVPLAPISTAI
jgi:hypothetical protein